MPLLWRRQYSLPNKIFYIELNFIRSPTFRRKLFASYVTFVHVQDHVFDSSRLEKKNLSGFNPRYEIDSRHINCEQSIYLLYTNVKRVCAA